MLGRLILLMTLVPFIEIYLLLKIGQAFGAGPTFALIILTGVLGAMLLQKQGHSIMREMQMNAAQNQLPADAVVKGLFTFLGGLLLLTPGILTDVIGFSLILPGTQHLWRAYFKKQWEAGVKSGSIRVYSNQNFGGKGFYYSQSTHHHRAKPTHLDERTIDIEAKSSETKRD